MAVCFFAAFVCSFAWQMLPVWKHEGSGYVTGGTWFYRTKQFGCLPMIYGTMAVAGVALVLAAPLGLGAALFTAEYLPRRTRVGVKVLIEILAGIPSVIYGLLGVLLVREWVYRVFASLDILSGDTLFTGGILLAVMILPTIVTLGDDALRAVPGSQRRAARALGLTKAETILLISLPQSIRGLLSALLLALGRAFGETIATFLVVGRQDNHQPENWFSLRPLLEAGETLTTKLGGSETNIAYGGSQLHWAAIVGLGFVLLVMVGTITAIGIWQGKAQHA